MNSQTYTATVAKIITLLNFIQVKQGAVWVAFMYVLKWADTWGHVAGTCRSDMLQRQKLVKYTLRRHVAGTCSGDM